MPYEYVAYTNEQKIVKGAINVASETAAEQALERQGYKLVTLKPVATMPAIEQVFPSLFKIKQKEIINFSRQLATLFEAGIGVVSALEIIQEQTGNRLFRKLLVAVLDDLRAGTSFSDALARHSKVFGEVYCKLVAVGEQTGNLEAALKRAATYIEKENTAQKKIKRALTYPIIVLNVALVVIAVLIIFVLPAMANMFTSMGAQLPLTTRLLMAIPGFISAHKPVLLLGLGVLVFGGVIAFRQSSVRYQLDRLLLTMPVIGRVNLMNEISRFSRTMVLLSRAGLPLPDVLEIVRQTSGNRVVRDSLTRVQRELVQGQGLSEPMSKSKLFPRLLVQMVKVGEESGNLESTLAVVADGYEVEAEDKLSGLISLIEPAMTILLALIVSFIALSVITPMYSILGSLK